MATIKLGKVKHNIPRNIPAITSDEKWTERYTRLNATSEKIVVATIIKVTLYNLFLMIGASNIIEDIKKITEMVACPLGKLKPAS